MSILYSPCSPPQTSPFHRSPNVSVLHCFVLPSPAPPVSCPPCYTFCVLTLLRASTFCTKKKYFISLDVPRTDEPWMIDQPFQSRVCHVSTNPFSLIHPRLTCIFGINSYKSINIIRIVIFQNEIDFIYRYTSYMSLVL